jgi:peptide deformylase
MKEDFYIRIVSDDVLRTKACEVAQITEEERRLIRAMTAIMHTHQGVGIAANQVGVAKRIIVINPLMEKGKEIALINPVITKKKKKAIEVEGCLSVPGIAAEVRRAYRIEVEALDAHGKKIGFPAHDLCARIIQHEIAHLDGILFIDRVNFIGRMKFKKQLKELLKTQSSRRKAQSENKDKKN